MCEFANISYTGPEYFSTQLFVKSLLTFKVNMSILIVDNFEEKKVTVYNTIFKILDSLVDGELDNIQSITIPYQDLDLKIGSNLSYMNYPNRKIIYKYLADSFQINFINKASNDDDDDDDEDQQEITIKQLEPKIIYYQKIYYKKDGYRRNIVVSLKAMNGIPLGFCIESYDLELVRNIQYAFFPINPCKQYV